MTLVLRIESTGTGGPAIALRDGWVRTDDSLSIGRAAGNGLVLEDPASTISKRHCVIERDEQGFSILDTSRNGTFLNSSPQPLGRETPTPLNVGDVIGIGSFDLHVVSMDRQALPRGETATAQGVALPAGGDEAGFLGPVVPRALADAHLAKFDPQARPDRGQERLVIEPESFEPVSITLPDPTSPGALRRVDVDLFAESHPATAYADDTPEARMAFVQPKLRIEPIPEEWDLMEELGQMRPPLAVLIETSPPEEVPMAAAAAAPPKERNNPAPSDAGEAVAAFLQACGLTAKDLSGGDLVAIMQRAGAMLKTSVENLQALLESRVATGHHLSAERTMIGRTGNNPLKFIPDSNDALVAMLLANIPGFLAADTAVAQAFADLRSHQEALSRTPRSAVMDVCEKLAPETIEAKASSALTLGDWVRERLMLENSTRLWRSYRAAFDGVVAELDEQHGLPGRLLPSVNQISGAGHGDYESDVAHSAVTACRRRLGEDIAKC